MHFIKHKYPVKPTSRVQWGTALLLSIALSLSAAVGATAAAAADRPLSAQLNDAQKEGRIYASYALNRHLNPFEIKVRVEDTKAVLNGAVSEAVDRDLAEQIALNVNGIKTVENDIQVDEKLVNEKTPPRGGKRSFSTVVEDATITASVKSKLLWNEHTGGLKIDVDTRNGAVTLTGKTDTDAARDLAGLLAANTEGVRSVDNRLSVTPGGKNIADKARATAQSTTKTAEVAVSDAWITTKVKSSLLYSKNVSSRDIAVSTHGGVVKLSGKVDADSERELAIELAKNVRGVKDVDARGLQVSSRSDSTAER